MRDIHDWLLPYLKTSHVDPEAWIRFWLVEADAAVLTVQRVKGLVAYFQRDSKVTSGNWGDINHAAFAVGRDLFLTADLAFRDTLVKVRAQPDTNMAIPIGINRAAADIYAEIKAALGW